MKKIVPQDAPLQEGDTAIQTNGCRHTNPDICGSNGLKGTCAYDRSDGICKKPPRSWKKIYESLKSGNFQ